MDPLESELPSTPTRKIMSTFLFEKEFACSTPVAESFHKNSLSESVSTVLGENDLDSTGGFSDSNVVTIVDSESTITSLINKTCGEDIDRNEETCFPSKTEEMLTEHQEHNEKIVHIISDKKNEIGASDLINIMSPSENEKCEIEGISGAGCDTLIDGVILYNNNKMLEKTKDVCNPECCNKVLNEIELNNNEFGFKNIQSETKNILPSEGQFMNSNCHLPSEKCNRPSSNFNQVCCPSIKSDVFIPVEGVFVDDIKNNTHQIDKPCSNETRCENTVIPECQVNTVDSMNVNSESKYSEPKLENKIHQSLSSEKKIENKTINSGQNELNVNSREALKSCAMNAASSGITVAKTVEDLKVNSNAFECKNNGDLNRPSTSRHISYHDHQPAHNSSSAPLSQKPNSAGNTAVTRNIDEIACDEVNLTVTEDDVYYSKKDEISICFDTRNDNLLGLEESSFKRKKPKRRSKGRGSNASKLLTLDVSVMKEKLKEEGKPPPAKKLKLEPLPASTERPLEVFVSNNACENADNNNPQWQVYKKLTNDELRYECIRKKWLNPQIPNFNENLSTYNWRARNGLPPVNYPRHNVTSYFNTAGGNIREIFGRARYNAKTLYTEKVRALARIRDQQFNAADEELHFSFYQTNPQMRHQCYSNRRHVFDSIQSNFDEQSEILLSGLEARVAAINNAQEEATTVSNFYKGLNTKGGASRTRLNSWQLSCWFDREDILNNYEVIYSE